MSVHDEPMLANVIAHAPTCTLAIARLCEALHSFAIAGAKSNLAARENVPGSESFADSAVHTGLIAELI